MSIATTPTGHDCRAVRRGDVVAAPHLNTIPGGIDHTTRGSNTMLMADRLDVRLSAAIVRTPPGPLVGPLYSTMGDHHRHPDDRARCVCGALWVQAMTCHPCRLGPHTGRDCVDGPPTVPVPHRDGTARFVYADRSAGRWCSCQHLQAPALDTTVDTPPVVTADQDITEAAAFGHPGYMAELNTPRLERPAPYLAPALAASGFRRGLRASDVARDRLLQALAERTAELMRLGAERTRRAEARPRGRRRVEGVAWAEGFPATVQWPDGERPEARVFLGAAVRPTGAGAAAARSARLIGVCGAATE